MRDVALSTNIAKKDWPCIRVHSRPECWTIFQKHVLEESMDSDDAKHCKWVIQSVKNSLKDKYKEWKKTGAPKSVDLYVRAMLQYITDTES